MHETSYQPRWCSNACKRKWLRTRWHIAANVTPWSFLSDPIVNCRYFLQFSLHCVQHDTWSVIMISFCRNLHVLCQIHVTQWVFWKVCIIISIIYDIFQLQLGRQTIAFFLFGRSLSQGFVKESEKAWIISTVSITMQQIQI